MACVKTYITLRIFAASLHPDEIGAILGVPASETTPRDPASRYPTPREWNFWCWDTRHVPSVETEDHIRAILDTFSPKRAAFEKLRALGAELDLYSYWVGNGQGGPYLDVPAMQGLCDLGLEIAWDTYFRSSDQQQVPGVSGSESTLSQPGYKRLYMIIDALELLKATWQTEAEGLDAARDDDRLGELGNDLALLDLTLEKFKADRDAIAGEPR